MNKKNHAFRNSGVFCLYLTSNFQKFLHFFENFRRGGVFRCVVRFLTPQSPPPPITTPRSAHHILQSVKWVMYCLQSTFEIDITCILVFRFTTRIRRQLQTILIFSNYFRNREKANETSILFSLSTRKRESHSTTCVHVYFFLIFHTIIKKNYSAQGQ